MNDIAKNITTLMEKEGISASELSKLTGIDRSVLHKIITGATKNPTIESIKPIISHYSYEEVVQGQDCVKFEKNEIPLISWSHAAVLDRSNTIQGAYKYIKTSIKLPENSFALLVEHTIDARFPAGALIIIDRDRLPKNLSYVIVKENEVNVALMKRFILEGSLAYLKPMEPSLPSVKYDKHLFKLIGVVIQSVYEFE